MHLEKANQKHTYQMKGVTLEVIHDDKLLLHKHVATSVNTAFKLHGLVRKTIAPA